MMFKGLSNMTFDALSVGADNSGDGSVRKKDGTSVTEASDVRFLQERVLVQPYLVVVMLTE